MAKLFPKTEEYLNGFYSSVKDNYLLSAEEINPDNGFPYRFKIIKEEHRYDLYYSIYSIGRSFGIDKSLLELEVPDDFVTPIKVVEEIIRYKDYLIKNKENTEKFLPEYASIKYELYPIVKTLKVINEVIDVINYVLTFDEILPYLNADNKLYNLYLKNGDDIKIKHCLNLSDVSKVLAHIGEQKSNVIIDGKLIPLNDIQTIQIYDTSLAFNNTDKGALKNEMDKYKMGLSISGLALLKHCGLDATHKFQIPDFNQHIKINTEIVTTNKSNTNRIFISHSSKDEPIITKFIDLVLILGMGLERKDIFCTSTHGTDIKCGLDFKEVIKKELLGSKAVIQIITRNYKASEVCLNEMGAAWLISPIVIPIVAEPFNYDVGFIHANSQQLKLNSHDNLVKLYDDHKKELFLKPIDVSVLNKKITEFTTWLTSQSNKLASIKVENKELIETAKKMLIKDHDVFKVKNRNGIYLKKEMIYHLFPDEITLKLMGYNSNYEPTKEIGTHYFEKMTKGQNLQSVHGAELIQERNSKHYWILLNNKRHGVPDVDTINYLTKNCSCKPPGILSLTDFENRPQENDLTSIKKIMVKIKKSGW